MIIPFKMSIFWPMMEHQYLENLNSREYNHSKIDTTLSDDNKLEKCMPLLKISWIFSKRSDIVIGKNQATIRFQIIE